MNTEPVFTIGGAFSEAYSIIKPKFWTVVGQFALMFIVYAVLVSIFADKNFLFSIIRLIVILLFTYVATLFSLSYVEKGSFSFSDLKNRFSYKRFCYFGSSAILYGLAVLGGFILLFIPGIIASLMLYFYRYTSIDMHLGSMNALKESRRITKGHRLKLLGFSFVSALVIFVGFLGLFVGSFFTIPLALIADTIIYKKISAHAGGVPAGENETVTEAPKEAVSAEATLA